jgi:superfamily II DNA or RNA helicase
MKTLLKPFQNDCVENAVSALGYCLQQLDKVQHTQHAAESRRLIAAHNSVLLFEAPTGVGKTLMAGTTVSRLSGAHKMLWFWFAPFSGVVAQTGNVIRCEFSNLRLKDVTHERFTETLRSGDTFVCTWSGVAVSNKDSRKSRTSTETQLGLDDLIKAARADGFYIGCVIDEAHHGFKSQTQAFAFYNDSLTPDVTILCTATPKDRDIDAFKKVAGIQYIHKVSVSRATAIEQGLIKQGVRVAVFKARHIDESLIDFRKTAVHYGVMQHLELKRQLQAYGTSFIPLLLVQVNGDNEIKEAKSWLQEYGISGAAIRVHTANEPDPDLVAIAHDDETEVLIFKLAIATGFDAPRASTLVSLRNARDKDFGIQIVGRLMRVERRLQGRADVPLDLRYGYVFLANKDEQTGLSIAAQEINTIKDALSDVSTNVRVAVVQIGEQQPAAQVTDASGQMSLLTAELTQPSPKPQPPTPSFSTASEQTSLWAAPEQPIQHADKLEHGKHVAEQPQLSDKGLYLYPLRTDLDFPRYFQKVVVSLDNDQILADIINTFTFSEDVLKAAFKDSVQIIKEMKEVFSGKVDAPEKINATLAQQAINEKAQQNLFKANDDGYINVRELQFALERRLKRTLEERGWTQFTAPEQIRRAMNNILALTPDALKQAIRKALLKHMQTADTAPLPEKLQSFEPLDASRLNIYGRIPADLNSWEREFAEELDRDVDNIIRWWHRNPVRQPYSVHLPIEGQPIFYPDFIVGIHDRKRSQEGILLVEIKGQYNDHQNNAQTKSQASHLAYGNVMMLYREGSDTWRMVEYSEKLGKNVLGQILDFEQMKTF